MISHFAAFQILVDGVVVGDAYDVQDLIDDGDLGNLMFSTFRCLFRLYSRS